MTTMDGTVPVPPRDVVPHVHVSWHEVLVTCLVTVLVAVPIAIGWTIGIVVRATALVVAASAEAYASGRGPRE